MRYFGFVVFACFASSCGAPSHPPTAQEADDPGSWTAADRKLCGKDPALDIPLEGSVWNDELGCRSLPSVADRCAADPDSRLYRPMFCAGEPMAVECGNREEAYLTARRLLPCVCMTEQRHREEEDYCENAP